MKLIALSVISWLLGLAIILLPFYPPGGGLPVRPASEVHAPGALVAAVLTFALLNTPGLFCVRQLCGRDRSALTSGAFFALAVDAPILLLTTFLAGRTLAPRAAFLFIGTFVVIGVAFGLGFAWSCREKISA